MVYRFREDVAWREAGGAYHILTSDHYYHCVEDDVGVLLLKRLEKGATLKQLVRAVKEKFETGDADVEGDVRAFVMELVEKKVLQGG